MLPASYTYFSANWSGNWCPLTIRTRRGRTSSLLYFYIAYFKMFFAAFTSRSWCVLHIGQIQVLIDKVRSFFIYPQTLHCLLDGVHLAISWHGTPYQSDLYFICWRIVLIDASDKAFARCRFRNMFLIDKDSIPIIEACLTISLVMLLLAQFLWFMILCSNLDIFCCVRKYDFDGTIVLSALCASRNLMFAHPQRLDKRLSNNLRWICTSPWIPFLYLRFSYFIPFERIAISLMPTSIPMGSGWFATLTGLYTTGRVVQIQYFPQLS